MPVCISPWGVRLVLLLALGLVFPAGVLAQTQPEPPLEPAARAAVGDEPERVLIAPAELQKLRDQIEQFKKQAALRKPMLPSLCRLRIVVEKRGDTSLAAIRATYSFRTTVPNTTISLGGKRAFLVAAYLDSRGGFLSASIEAVRGRRRLPILNSSEEGFTTLIHEAGDHTLILDLEAPIVGRGTKTEVGFELGLPRAAITTLVLEPPGDLRRVNVATRSPDPSQAAKPPELRRVVGLDVKQLAPHGSAQSAYPLGPADFLEVSWDPPAAVTQPNEVVLGAEWEIVCKLSERTIETEAKLRPRGAARYWRVVLPKGADLVATRAVREQGMDPGLAMLPLLTRPKDANKPVWMVEIPVGSTAADWLLTATMRQDRARDADPNKPATIAVGPFAVQDVARQSGTLRVSAVGSVRFDFMGSSELQRMPVADTGESSSSELLFRLTTGPTNTAIPGPLLQFKAFSVAGAVRVKPTYRLNLTPVAWQVEADLQVTPVRTELDSLTIEVPANWRSLVAEPAELVEGVQQIETTDGLRRTAVIRLASGQRRPFELKLRASAPLGAGEGETIVLLPRFPSVAQRGSSLDVRDRDASVTAMVGAGLDVRGAGREWEGTQAASWGTALTAEPEVEGVPGNSVSGRFEYGLARVDLAWSTRHPELIAQMRAVVIVERRQLRITQSLQFRAAEGMPRAIRLRGPASLTGIKTDPPLRETAPGLWSTEAVLATNTLHLEFAVPGESVNVDAQGRWTVPVPLFWPIDATQTETTAQIAMGSSSIQLEEIRSPDWRDIPPILDSSRIVIPAAHLAASGTNIPLALTLRAAEGPGVTLVGVARSYIRVRANASGITEYDARFLVHRWLTDAIVVHVPGPLVGESPEVLLEGVPVAAGFLPDPDDPEGVVFHVPLPAARERSLVLEVKYQIADDALLKPPVISGATFDGPLRWQVMLPAGEVPFILAGGISEQQWSWRSGVLVPVSSRSGSNLEEWFRTGIDSTPTHAGAAGELVLRQSQPSQISLTTVPRFGLLALCSAAAFAFGFIVLQLRGSTGGPLVALLGGIAAAAAVLYPQPCSQIVGAIQPGLVVLLLLLGALAFRTWSARRRITHLPGFTRRRVESSIMGSTANTGSANRPQLLGSAGSDRPRNVEPHPTPGQGLCTGCKCTVVYRVHRDEC